ncbi:MAG TPA: hypothetical protein VFC51_05985 [Chloroflexota bacterium]|nr:hypothetical protein [Chloroflexota bacterium]
MATDDHGEDPREWYRQHVPVDARELFDGLTVCLCNMVDLNGHTGEPIPFSFYDAEPDLLLRLHGWRNWPFWISSPRFELYIGASAPFPPAYAQLHSEFIHLVGIHRAVQELEEIVARFVIPRAPRITVSRVDLYADEQGWEPQYDDFFRFTCRATMRRLHEQPSQLHTNGRRLSGFVFGKGDVLARIYDKSLEMQRRGETWQQAVWRDPDPKRSVWRVEYQFRRGALARFDIAGVGDALTARQGLWGYGMRWLSLRQPAKHVRRARSPEAGAWARLRDAQMGSPTSPLVREHRRAADELRLVRGFVGYASSLEAMGSAHDLGGAMARTVPAAQRYLVRRGVRYRDVVDDKRQRRLALPEGAGERS